MIITIVRNDKCMLAHTHTHKHPPTHTHTHTHAHTHARRHTHARTHARTHTHTHVCTLYTVYNQLKTDNEQVCLFATEEDSRAERKTWQLGLLFWRRKTKPKISCVLNCHSRDTQLGHFLERIMEQACF